MQGREPPIKDVSVVPVPKTSKKRADAISRFTREVNMPIPIGNLKQLQLLSLHPQSVLCSHPQPSSNR